MIVHLVDGRVKGFASRGLIVLSWRGVLCVRVAVATSPFVAACV